MLGIVPPAPEKNMHDARLPSHVNYHNGNDIYNLPRVSPIALGSAGTNQQGNHNMR